ncbi:alpha/beta hydrolase [Streptomyces sp. NBC_00233]|uniref:alpha/beta hydrolase n=1 Tax=Streptomyces sp. NBC_00233 TaxID=2975686 RepID=UPI00225377FB|nr:alpha/beta fold hydrolase [Streptomyces sp. NBC_00233]MCX5231120.1 alpha/beta hydrolase [Streptomyces sp. NBC_00233]
MAEQNIGPDGLPSVRGTVKTVRRRTACRITLTGSPHRVRTRTAFVAAGLAVLGALGPTPGSALSPPAEGPRPGHPARFVPGPCPETPEPIPGRCGFLEVPENRTRKKSRTIRTTVAIIPATSAKPAGDPVVFMEGGPGGDAIGAIPFLITSRVNRDRDLIVMTQRGALHSQPNLACPEMDRFNATAVGLPYDAPSTGRGLVRAAKECRDRLTAEGNDLAAYNTTENAADFAGLRTALGIKKWNVYGYSYGTDLGLTYLRRHPQGIRTLAIDSVVPPQTVSLPWAWDSAQEGINAIFAACEAQPACTSRYPDLSRTLTEQVRRLEANPLTLTVPPPGGGTPVKVVLDGGTLVNLLVTNGRLVPSADVPAALYELAAGNPERLARAQAAGATPAIGEFAHGLTHSVACAEWAPGYSKRDLLEAGRRAFPGFPDSVLAHAPQLPFEHDLCRAWNVPDRTAVQRVATHSKVPALIITGTFDAKTGASWGPFAGRTLPRSTAVVVPGITHWVVPQEPCAASVLVSFLARPTAPDTRCVAGVVPKPFTIIP